jgi:flagellar hook-associated protein 3 FlgL
MTRITDLARFSNAMFYLNQTQNRVSESQIQAASGLKAQTYAGISTDASRLLSLEGAHARVEQYANGNTLISSRLQTMETSVAQIYDAGASLKTLLVNALNNENASLLALSSQAQSTLGQVASLLNNKVDGRYLFAGSRTDTAPVDLTQLPANYVVPTSDGDSVGYYQGDSFKFAVQADDNFSVTYGVTADEAGFEKLIRALDLVVKSPPTDRTALDHALAVLNEALDEIPDIRTRIGSSMSSIDQVNKRHTDVQTYTEQTISDIQNVDVALVMTKLNSDSVSLQASYMSINTLSQLNLMNYLR